MSSEFAPTSAADIVWNQPPAPRPAGGAAPAPGAFREAVDRATAQRAPSPQMASKQMAAQQTAAAPAAPPREIVPHPFYEGEFIDARTGAIVQPAVTPVQEDPTDGGRLVPHPFYEGEYYDPHAAELAWFGGDGITVADVIDLVNPLQHIPIVSSIYREVTGDTIDPGIRLIAGAALGGPIGFAVAMINNVIEDGSGRDVGGHMLAMIRGDDDTGSTELAVLETASGAAPATPAASVAAATNPPASLLAAAASLGTTAPTGPSPVAAAASPAPHQPLIAGTHVPLYRPMTQTADAAGIPPTAPMLAAGPIPAMAGMPGLPGMPGASGKTPTPAEALLQARAAVPTAGPIAALGGSRATRIATAPAAPTPEQAQQLAISARLDAHLARLAAMSGERPPAVAASTAAVSPPPAVRPEAEPAPATATPTRLAPAATPAETKAGAPATVPTPLVPQAMSEALEKYRALMRPSPVRATKRDDST